jgi:hypothetical protein
MPTSAAAAARVATLLPKHTKLLLLPLLLLLLLHLQLPFSRTRYQAAAAAAAAAILLLLLLLLLGSHPQEALPAVGVSSVQHSAVNKHHAHVLKSSSTTHHQAVTASAQHVRQ